MLDLLKKLFGTKSVQTETPTQPNLGMMLRKLIAHSVYPKRVYDKRENLPDGYKISVTAEHNWRPMGYRLVLADTTLVLEYAMSMDIHEDTELRSFRITNPGKSEEWRPSDADKRVVLSKLQNLADYLG